MINQVDNFLWYKLNGLLRQAIVRGLLNPSATYIIINEYPKSGGTWLGQMLSEILSVHFPRNRLPMLQSCIMHGHYLHPWRLRNVVIMWRDGRDVIVSQYYHSCFLQEGKNERLVNITRQNLKFEDYSDIRKNLPRFMEYVFEKKVTPRFNWPEFVTRWADGDAVHVKYEDLRRNTAKELKRVIIELTGHEVDQDRIDHIVQKYTFENQSGRAIGNENINSFLRKGIIGDWKNHFTKKSKELFRHYAGKELITLGYEKDYAWVE